MRLRITHSLNGTTWELTMMSDAERQTVLSKIRQIETFITTRDRKPIAISEVGKAEAAKSAQLRQSSDSLAPILRTALVINARESAMRHRYERFIATFPEIATLSGLQRAMDSTEPLEFCRTYLDIRAKIVTNPKYCLLKVLTDGFLKYQKENGWPTEIEAIRQWSRSVDVDELEKDPIGRLHGVGPGVVGNIKLCLGEPVVKRDRHVVGVMTKIFQADVPRDFKKFITFMEEFAQSAGIPDLPILRIRFFLSTEKRRISPLKRHKHQLLEPDPARARTGLSEAFSQSPAKSWLAFCKPGRSTHAISCCQSRQDSVESSQFVARANGPSWSISSVNCCIAATFAARHAILPS